MERQLYKSMVGELHDFLLVYAAHTTIADISERDISRR